MRKLLMVVLVILMLLVPVTSVLAAYPSMGGSGAIGEAPPGWAQAGSGNASRGPGGAPNELGDG
jgi:hypothetical protein